jgi:chromosome segregation ATPase
MASSAIDAVADELYALRPSEFTRARDARASEAKAEGDAETARQVKALRKPTVAAWLANQLVREHRDEVSPLLELGAALREATATLSGPQLRQLSRQRNEVVQALVRKARRLAADAGQPVSEDAARALEGTLNAALADDEAAQQLLQGRLTDPLQHVGFGPGSGSTTGPDSRARKPEPAPAGAPKQSAADRRAEQRERLERDLAEAWATARAAADARTVAEEAATAAGREATGLRRRVDQARADLEAAEQALERAAATSDEASTARDTARSDAEKATRRVSALQRELDALSARSKKPVSRSS